MSDWIDELVDAQLEQCQGVYITRPLLMEYDDLWMAKLTRGSKYPADDAVVWCREYEIGEIDTIPDSYYWYEPDTFIREDMHV